MNDLYNVESIERKLLQLKNGIDVAVTVSPETGDLKSTMIYIVMQNAAVDRPTILNEINQKLPELVGHAEIVWLPELPRTESGEVDMAVLSSLDSSRRPLASTNFLTFITEQVERTPDKVALQFGDKHLTYRELDEKSNQLANFLRKNNVKEESIIPICIHRSLEMVIGILGILKAGGAYVPIDPDYPKDRIDYVLSDINPELAVTDVKSSSLVSYSKQPIKQVCIDRDWDEIQQESTQLPFIPLGPQSLAYILYTSGTTGKPKGVLIEHQSLLNFLVGMLHQPALKPDDLLLSVTTISFDIIGLDLFLPLMVGASIRLTDMATTRDGRALLRLLMTEPITVLQATPSTWRMLLDAGWTKPLPLKALCGGEPLSKDLAEKLLTRVDQLWNLYGPTETTVWTTLKQVKNAEEITVGKPIAHTFVYILDEQLQPVTEGEVGEIWIGGAGVGRGYLNRAELTQERFLANPFDAGWMYRTGDLGRVLASGEIQCLGRIDHQVKIRGFRIELGEIEYVLQQCAGVKQCVVDAKEDSNGYKRLIGYVVMDGVFDKNAIVSFLSSKLPDYMIPPLIMELSEIPITANGKIDRKKLPNPDVSDLLNRQFITPNTRFERKLATLWQQLLNINRVSVHDNFFELGGNSLLATNLMVLLKDAFSIDLPVTVLYQHSTLLDLSNFIEGKTDENGQNGRKKKEGQSDGDIAVIGMTARFPGASTLEELWNLLKEGREAITFFSEEDLDPSLPNELTLDPNYVRAKGIIPNADGFDAAFFGINPKLAELMDPQQRVFLEIAWESLEQAGYLHPQFKGSIGVFAGCGENMYFFKNVLSNPQLVNQVGNFQVMKVNEKDYIASRTAYQLNLNGPAVSVHSACSTSLLAIAQAVDSIRNGQCEMALAGGASVSAPHRSGHLYEEGSILSRDGHCRSFDASANGTVFGDGVGVVLLKRAEAARKDGDKIYAIIKGTGVNNDGAKKGSFTAPSAEGQSGAIRMALDDAAVDPATISYVETHGTATPIGDPIEIEGLKMAFGTQPAKQYCAIGSIKSNMGHLDAAAGVAGFIKTALALYHRQIPPSINYAAPNPLIDFAESPFFVNTTHTEWTQVVTGPEHKRRAGVSSFGIGGTNVHVILEENGDQPVENKAELKQLQRPVQLITWSAKSNTSLANYAQQLAQHVEATKTVSLTDLAYTLQATRHHFNYRRFVTASTPEALIQQLNQKVLPFADQHSLSNSPEEVVFLFPGQGSQYVNMGRDLYQHEPVFRQAVDECAELIRDYSQLDIRQILYAEVSNPAQEEQLKNTRFAQPALFITEYALAKLWMSWGIKPSVVCGHSVGEFVGAHLAGVFTLKDALKLIAHRGRLISELPTGSMLSVKLELAKLESLLPATLSVAAINAGRSCVVSGPKEAIASFSGFLDEKEIPNRVLATSHAFHSAMMDPAVLVFEKIVQETPLNRPQIPIISTVTGQKLTDAQSMDPNYWATQLRLPVRFSQALDFIFAFNNPVCVEVGPGNAVSTMARQQLDTRQAILIAGLHKREGQSDYQPLLQALGEIWACGIEPDWKEFYANQAPVKIELPTYAFDRNRYWIDPIIPSLAGREPVKAFETNPVTASGVCESKTLKASGRADILLHTVKAIITDISGLNPARIAPEMSFYEIGLDSLTLTQVSLKLKKEFELPITFRDLNQNIPTLASLITYLDSSLPKNRYASKNESLRTGAEKQLDVSVADQPVKNSNYDLKFELILKQLKELADKVDGLQNSVSNKKALPSADPEQSRVSNAHLTGKESNLTRFSGQMSGSHSNFSSDYDFNVPPVPEARIGKDSEGNPGWFIPDPKRPGKFLQLLN